MAQTIAAWLFLSALFAPPLVLVVAATWVAIAGNTRRVEPSRAHIAAPAHH